MSLTQPEDIESIALLEKDVEALNSIFRELSVIVHDQNGYFDTIEANMTQTVKYTSGALEETRKAQKYQKNNNNTIGLLGTLVGAGTILGLIFGLKRK